MAACNNPALLHHLLRAIIGDLRKLAEYTVYQHGRLDGHLMDDGRHRGMR